MNIYVGNLNAATREPHIKELFLPFGKVINVKIIMDFKTGQSQGYGFVEIDSRIDGNEAIRKLNNFSFMDSSLEVYETRPNTSVKPGRTFSPRAVHATQKTEKKK